MKKNPTVKEMMNENEKFFNNVLRIVRNGGMYICPNTLNVFNVINKKLIPTTQRAYDWIKGVTSTEWCESNVEVYINPSMN